MGRALKRRLDTPMSPPVFRLGLDLIDIARFARALERHGARLLQRVFTPAEQALAQGRVERLAARFAAKEAAAKALGTGIGPIAWVDIEVLSTPQGEPLLRLHRAAAQRAAALGLTVWTVSLSHSRYTAAAVVLAWGPSPAEDEPCA